MNDLEMAAKFREAADLLRERGWTQGRGMDDDGRLCGSAALCSVLGARRFACNLTAVLQIHDALPVNSLPLWNDQPGRTKEEVIALFEGLAHDLELRHQVAAIAEKGDEQEPQPQEPEKEPVYA